MEVTVPFEVKAVKTGSSIRVTSPKEIVDYIEIAEGDTLVVYVSN